MNNSLYSDGNLFGSTAYSEVVLIDDPTLNGDGVAALLKKHLPPDDEGIIRKIVLEVGQCGKAPCFVGTREECVPIVVALKHHGVPFELKEIQ